MRLPRPLLPFIRYAFGYSIRPKLKPTGGKRKSPDYIGEVKAWIVKEPTSPYKDKPDYFYDGGTYEDWLKKEGRNPNTHYAKSIISGHQRNPWATLSQLRYKPRPMEKKLSEAKKLLYDEEDLYWQLRSEVDKILVARAKGINKRLDKWLSGVILEEIEGLSKQEISHLDENDKLNIIKTLMYFNERGDDEYTSVIDGVKRKGRIYTGKDIKEWISNMTPGKKAEFDKKFAKKE